MRVNRSIFIPLVIVMIIGLHPISILPLIQGGKYAASGLKDAEAQQFFKALQQAIDKRDKQAVASMVSYPIVVVINGKRQSIKNDVSMIKNYDYVFDKRLSEFLVQTKIEELWARDQGVATPGGEIWFSGVNKDPQHLDKYEIKIIAINGIKH
jgi:hypothetical protein